MDVLPCRWVEAKREEKSRAFSTRDLHDLGWRRENDQGNLFRLIFL